MLLFKHQVLLKQQKCNHVTYLTKNKLHNINPLKRTSQLTHGCLFEAYAGQNATVLSQNRHSESHDLYGHIV